MRASPCTTGRRARAALDQMVATVESYANTDPKNPGRMDLAQHLHHPRQGRAARPRLRGKRCAGTIAPWRSCGRSRQKGSCLPAGGGPLEETEKAADDCRDILKAVDDIDFALEGARRRDDATAADGSGGGAGRRGRPAEAAATAETMRELKPQDGANLYNVACCYALCVPAVGAGNGGCPHCRGEGGRTATRPVP